MLSNLHYFTICTIRLYQNKTFELSGIKIQEIFKKKITKSI